MEDFTIDSAKRLREQQALAEKQRKEVEADDAYMFRTVEKFETIPYTPPVTIWKPNTTTLRAFAAQCFKAMMP